MKTQKYWRLLPVALLLTAVGSVAADEPASADSLIILDATTARLLRDGRPESIRVLQRVRELKPDAAQVLIEEFREELYLDQLQDLPESVAGILAQHAGKVLSLNGIPTLSAEAAAALARFRLVSEESDLLEGDFEAYGGVLQLDGVESLSLAAAENLVQFQGQQLSLGGLPFLTTDVARILARYEGGLMLNGLQQMTPEIAEIFGESVCFRLSSGMPMLEADVAERLAGFSGAELEFSGVNALSLEAALQISRYRGELVLPQCQNLPDNVLQALVSKNGFTRFYTGRRGGLSLGGIINLTRNQAQILATAQTVRLSLSGIETVDEDVLRDLVKFDGEELCLNGLRELSAESAAVLSQFNAPYLELNGLRELSPDVLREFSAYRGELSLLGVRSISAEVAKMLLKHERQIHFSQELLQRHRNVERAMINREFDRAAESYQRLRNESGR